MSVNLTIRPGWRLAIGMLGWLWSTGAVAAKVLPPEGPTIARPTGPTDPAAMHVVDFTDDSMLHGTVTEVTKEALFLQRSDASELMKFPLPSLSRIVFENAVASVGITPRSTVQLITGDWFVADVLVMREGKVDLRLANQQRLTLDQKWIDWVCFAKGAAPDVFHGPTSMEGWTSNGSWSCQKGVLRCQQLGNLVRDFPVVPDRIDLSFEMEKGEVQKNFMMSFNFNREVDETSDGSMNSWTQVRVNEGQLYIYAANGNKNKNFSRTLPRLATRPNEQGTFRYRVLIDRIAGRIVLLINGRVVADQTAIPTVAAGTWNGKMTFQPMRWGSDADWSIGDIHVLPWDGQVPQAEGASTPARLDTLTMEDGTVKLGRFEGMLGAVVKFRSTSGSEEIDRASIAMLHLHRKDATSTVPAPEAAPGPQLTLADRGELKLKTLQYSDHSFVLGTTFGLDLTLPAAGVTALTFPHAEVKDVAVTDRLVFRNGDLLRGTLKAASHDQPLQWLFPNGAQIGFQTKRVGGVLLSPRANTPMPTGDTIVRFRNGDWLGGKLLALDATNLRLQSGFGNEFQIPRPQVQTLYLSKPGQAAIWEGATQPESWWKGITSQNNQWMEDEPSTGRVVGPHHKIYLDGAFLLPAGAGRGSGLGKPLEGLPERVEISFEVAGASHSPAFTAQILYEGQGNNGIMMQVWQGGLYLYDMTPRNRKGQNFGGGQPQQVQWGEKIDSNARKHRFRILADRRAHKAAIFIDDVLITSVNRKPGKDPEKEDDSTLWGNGLSFSSNGGNGATVFNRLWITPWNGQMPSTLKSEPTSKPQESIALANGDEAKATIKLAGPTSFTLDLEGEEIQVPREKILLADFGTAPASENPPLQLTEGQVPPRLRLAQGGALTVETLRLSEDQVTCGSASFGELKVPLGTFSEIIWSGLDRDLQMLQAKPKAAPRKAVRE